MGRPARGDVRARQLRPLWQGASRFVVNGDAAEIQMPEFRNRAVSEVNALFDLCDHDGVELALVAGNHDAFITEERHLLLAQDRVLVTHGDVFHPAVAPWVPEAREAMRLHDQAMAGLRNGTDRQPNAAELLKIAQQVSYHQFVELAGGRRAHGLRDLLKHPAICLRVLDYWRRAPELAHDFTQRHFPTVKAVIFGHSHRPGVWQRGGRHIINTGAFSFPGKPWAVTVSGEQLRVWRVKKRGGNFALDDKPLHSVTL